MRRGEAVGAAGKATAVSLPAISAAVALLTRQHSCPDASRAEILDDSDPAEVLEAMEALAGGLLAGALPGDAGTTLLRRVGLLVADLEGGQESPGGAG
jgi:hypothetical protein